MERDAGVKKDYYFESRLFLKYYIKRGYPYTTYFRYPFENHRESTKIEIGCRRYFDQY